MRQILTHPHPRRIFKGFILEWIVEDPISPTPTLPFLENFQDSRFHELQGRHIGACYCDPDGFNAPKFVNHERLNDYEYINGRESSKRHFTKFFIQGYCIGLLDYANGLLPHELKHDITEVGENFSGSGNFDDFRRILYNLYKSLFLLL